MICPIYEIPDIQPQYHRWQSEKLLSGIVYLWEPTVELKAKNEQEKKLEEMQELSYSGSGPMPATLTR